MADVRVRTPAAEVMKLLAERFPIWLQRVSCMFPSSQQLSIFNSKANCWIYTPPNLMGKLFAQCAWGPALLFIPATGEIMFLDVLNANPKF
jgi:hypothetical protein